MSTLPPTQRQRRSRSNNDDSTVRLSKALSYVLRHGAAKEGISMRTDGYVRLNELLSLPRFKTASFEEIETIVKTNDKQRFSLINEVDETTGVATWWIRANQGHTMNVEDLKLEAITDPAQIPIVVHGTYLKNWQNIASQGLSKMRRNHIHFAVGLYGESGVISGMRADCDLFIYMNVQKAIADGIEIYRSENNVILTPGKAGILSSEYFLKVVDRSGNVLLSNEK
ncbi:11109_t:CDS:2 [Paraglomus occultum]|uniref:2'-phosphotransferase n=1 Tax=Paraglomus occultum TaxID=144539 RepID=A0A9N9A7P0_9GLOM|nr:11109_t:CDS:2 [Paraglomus occultum]